MSKAKITVGASLPLTKERLNKVRSDYLNALEKLERLLSKKEAVVFNGVDYTTYEIQNLHRELDWYENFMEENKVYISMVQPESPMIRRTHPYHSKSRDTLPAKKRKSHYEDSVKICPIIRVG